MNLYNDNNKSLFFLVFFPLIPTQKSYFPHNFVNKNNLDFIGPTPDISLFDGISNEEYEGLVSYT